MEKLSEKYFRGEGRNDKFTRWSGIMIISALCLSIMSGSGCKSGSDNKVATGKVDVLKLLPGNNNPRNSEGDFVTLKDGRIFFIYSHYTGTSGDDNANAFLAGRYYNDKDKNWSGDVTVVKQEGTMNVMSVSLLRLQSGEIALFYLKKNSETDCIPMLRISADETASWSEPVACITDKPGYFVLNNNRVIQLKNGRIMMAVALHQSPGETRASSVGRLWSYFSDDNGRTWKSSQEVANPGAIVTQEPGLVELKSGEVLMFIRTTAGVQYFSFSKDKGETWSPVEPGNIKSPCSPAIIARIPSKDDLLMVWNDNGASQKRTPLNIAISKDEGKTWINNKILENRPDGVFCYPAVHFVDNALLLNYSDWSTMGCTIARIDLDWIYK
jgi:sialidase-1